MSITKRQPPVITLFIFAFLSLFIMISASLLLTSNVYATPIMNNSSNFKPLPSSSSSFTNKSNYVNQSSRDMTTMMKEMMIRGNIAMGFNQNKIIHQFVATPSDGKIIITALNSSDRNTVNQIRNHVMDIRKEFSEGNFTKPLFIHAQQVPGTKIMSYKKDLIKYGILKMKNGSTLILTTDDKQLIDAISQFMKFQTSRHYGH